MNKETLLAKGLTEEQADAVLKLHEETLDGNFVTKARFNEVNDELKLKKTEVEERDNQLEELRKVDPKELASEIDTLQSKNNELQETHKAELTQLKIDHAVETQLLGAGAKNVKAVKALLNTNDFELQDDGTVKGLADQTEALKQSDAYLFDGEADGQAPKRIFPPGNPNGGSNKPNPFAKETWNLTEQGRIYKENPDLYNSLKAQAGK